MTPPRKRGGQTLYTLERDAAICEYLAQGWSLREIGIEVGLAAATIVRWTQDPVNCPGFAERYAEARGRRLEVLADEIIEISDDSSNDYMDRTRQDGSLERVLDHEHVQRSRLRVDSRKWILSKLRPGVYGDKITQEISGPGGGDIPTRVTIEFVE